jgi:hypothetical protein
MDDEKTTIIEIETLDDKGFDPYSQSYRTIKMILWGLLIIYISVLSATSI